MEHPGLRFAAASLAAWRLSHLIAEEDGPADAVVRLRRRLGESWLGDLADCFACVSVWVAMPLAPVVARRPRDLPVAWLALSGAACLLERATAERPCLRLDAAGLEWEGDADELLREEAEVA